ncbi:MAG: PDGLE domain-containing protein [Candidatus Thorarchaeota archaeon]
MSREKMVRVVLPSVIFLVAVLSAVILTGMASQNPDGFEWTLFDFAGVAEPEPLFEGIWSFMEEGPVTDVIIGVVGVVLVLAISYVLFWALSRRNR